MASAEKAGATNRQQEAEAAGGRHVGVCTTTFGNAALRLLDNGYLPIPLMPAQKRPALKRWSAVPIDQSAVEDWTRQFPGHGIGLRTGALVGVDIDILDPDLAHRIDRMARARLGDTLVRVGLWPKRLLLYQTATPFAKMAAGGVEVLGLGQQFVAFGIHPSTGGPYDWPLGETPLEVPLDALPPVDASSCAALLGEIASLLPPAVARAPATRERASIPRPVRAAQRTAEPAQVHIGMQRDANGRVVDGRDGWLSTIAYHAVHDAAGRLGPRDIAVAVWQRFAATADLDRPAAGGAPYSIADAERKVAGKLRLFAEGRLPRRDEPGVEADYQVPTLSAAEARTTLDAQLGAACDAIEAWHTAPESAPPRIGIRATVGLGKSASARRQLLRLRERLIAIRGPSRLVVLTPSHALAEEAAVAWRAEGVSVAVLRGYEAVEPRTRTPMCRDVPAVKAAIDARLSVHKTVCAAGDRRCAFFDGCLKQRNRSEVATADVVVAAHQALTTGFNVTAKSIAAILIDESHWGSAIREPAGIAVDTLAHELLGHRLGRGDGEAAADLHDLRCRAAEAFAEPGPAVRSRLLAAGLDAAGCQLAASLEERRLRKPRLYPGMPAQDRWRAAAQAKVNARTHSFIELWQAMAELAAGTAEHDGRLFVRRGKTGSEVVFNGPRPIHPKLRGRPILHLDATLRPELARAVLPGLEMHAVEAAAPHMAMQLVVGSFGKGGLCPEPGLDPAEAQRRANRLAEVVDYVAWQARRVAPGRVLVVTYKACEAAFESIPGVETGHFNAIAGLDVYRDVRLLVVVGRPLPSDAALAPLSGALFRHLPEGAYTSELRGVRMRDGSSRAIRVRSHVDDKAELLRAAICDDQLIQAIGRGRGVNRSADDPLDVHLLADVALPLVHDAIVAWETVQPDLFQRMLLAGIAVDSPADAAVLHPALFASSSAAEKAFQREGFGGQSPIRDIYREMSAKSAAYRRGGRGRSWQRAWWLDGEANAARSALEAALGALAEWKPDR